MSTLPRVARAMRRVLVVSAEEAGRESGFVRRERKLTGATFVQSLVFGWLQNPEATASERAQAAATCGVQISAYGLDKRLDDERASECLRRVLAAAMREVVSCASSVAVPILRRFNGVYLYDGSVVRLPDALAGAWPGCGGSRGRTAALKIGARLELLGGELYVPQAKAGRAHDRTLALEAESMPQGALRLADLGFFDLELFASLEAKGCYWLTRLMARTALYDERDGHRLNLEGRLRGLGRRTLELGVRVGTKARVPARLCWRRASMRRWRTRGGVWCARRRAGANSRCERGAAEDGRMDHPPDQRACAELLGVEEALVLMRARWQIEKLFELWKRYGRLDESRSGKPRRVLCELYAKLYWGSSSNTGSSSAHAG